MELRNILTFLKIAELQSFTKAAAQLGYNQSTVTVQIKQLESELGIMLFDRIGKNIKLTQKGTEFFEYANQIAEISEKAKKIAMKPSQPKGKLKIGMLESLAMSIFPEILYKFHNKYPYVETVVKADATFPLFEMLNHNEVDMLFIFDKKYYNREWITSYAKEDDVVFVTSSSNPIAGKKDTTIDDILKQPFMLTEKGVCYRAPFEEYLSTIEKSISPFLEIGNTETIIYFLKKGMGISLLPYYTVKKSIEKGELSIIDIKDFRIKMYIQILRHKNKWVTPQMQALEKLIINELE
ncbi:MAG: LysR family transcriptional regulator [Clostridia bacterium]|jgi:DNA-binding transcriptional LysR family regulator|nr:LysR family transcriptional regulator [Clostridia bacterium]MCI1958265.1 LysR family transcriptional regulator [Clostridia bacterium]MCI2001282.1 LysR family transcriptional regulator [Clostridia bacterium]MCI2015957.1 LysR family transcriptional regulator [Clostridia bacterium]